MGKLSSKEVSKRYDDFAKYYDFAEIFTNLLFGKHRKKIARDVHGKVLEVGIGTGANLKYYSKDIRLYGIDISKKMLARARMKAERLGLNVNFKIGKAEKLPFEKEKFDFVIDTLGMCSYTDPVKAMNEMRRVCKRSGKIILFEHGISNNKIIRNVQEKRETKHYSKVGCSLIHNYSDILKKAKIKKYHISRNIFGILWTISI